MSDVTYHVGKFNNTDRRCVIVYPSNPHNPETALVVDTDALPPRLHDALMTVVQDEGNTSPILANILSRRVFTDTGIDLMNTLFLSNVLQSVSVDMITLFPRPNMPVPLRQAIDMMGKSTTSLNENAQPAQPAPETFNPHAYNSVAEKADNMVATAQNILIEADLLESEAKRKREQAYAMAPSLRPTVVKEEIVAPDAKTVSPTAPAKKRPGRPPKAK